jgi:hypothetical protein
LRYHFKEVVMTKFILALTLFATTFSVIAQQNSSKEIIWPSAYNPSKSKFYVHNEIEVSASPETVWAFLIDALKWQSWYVGAKNVSFTNSTDTVLNSSSAFKWQTMGLKFTTSVKQFESNRLLAWESVKKSIQGYHIWLSVPIDKGCMVITDESQNGWLSFFENTFQRNKLKKLHEVWLAALKKKSENN